MPKVLSHTPSWLSRPSPGYHLFEPNEPYSSKSLARLQESAGLRRTIATRDSEIFVAAGHEIRWADLAQLKEDDAPTYRKFSITFPLPIKRLTMSPAGDFLAVSTSHTIHIVCLPDSSLLSSIDNSPIKPKMFQVGPTVHVLENAPIASVLWHPLGYRGHCLVTITLDGAVRLWELNRADRQSFGTPTLTLDLVKLATAQNANVDLEASTFGTAKGFSPDMADLEVASACFGDWPEQEGVHGWAPVTLWIGTVAGEVYALCPLLPSKWQLLEAPSSSTFLQTLGTSIDVFQADISEDDDASHFEKLTADKQLSWKSDILYEEPLDELLPDGDKIKVFRRPSSVPAIPMLQGPFIVNPEVDDFELSDMVVYSLKSFSDPEEDGDIAEGLPAALVCLLTDTCQVHVCLDVHGVMGRWLPDAQDECEPEVPEHGLILAETITLADDCVSSSKQSITQDVHTDFSFFVTHSSGVYYVSMESWIRSLEAELSENQLSGSNLRIKSDVSSARTKVELSLRRRPGDVTREITSCAVIEDGNVGYILLTTVDDEPQAVILDAPEDDSFPTDSRLEMEEEINLPTREVREPWNPPKDLWKSIDLLNALQIPGRHRASLKEEVKLSPANLELLMGAHRVLAEHTDKLQHAVSDLFNRCQRLQDEYRDQIWRAAQLAPKIDAVTGDDEGTDSIAHLSTNAKLEHRLEKVKERQEAINARYQALRRKASGINTTLISDKEVAFTSELEVMDRSIHQVAENLTDDVDGSEIPAWQRLEKIKEKKEELKKQVEQTTQQANGDGERQQGKPVKMTVPSYSRKLENEQVQLMLQHQGDLLEATTNRLKSIGIPIRSMPVEGL